MPHVLEHHGERFSVRAHAVEADDVLVLEHGQELGLALEVLSSRLVGVLQRLRERESSEEDASFILSHTSDQLLLGYPHVYTVGSKSLHTLPGRMNGKT